MEAEYDWLGVLRRLSGIFVYWGNLAECVWNWINWCPTTSVQHGPTKLGHHWLILHTYSVGDAFDTRWTTLNLGLACSSLLTRESYIRNMSYLVHSILYTCIICNLTCRNRIWPDLECILRYLVLYWWTCVDRLERGLLIELGIGLVSWLDLE